MTSWLEEFDLLRENWRFIDNFPEGSVPSRREMERHGEMEILIVISGTSPFAVNGREGATAPGDIFFFDSWMAHQMSYSPGDRKLWHLWIHFGRGKLFATDCRIGADSSLRQCIFYEFPPDVVPVLLRRWRSASMAKSAEERNSWYRSIIRLLVDESRHLDMVVYRTRTGEDIISQLSDYIAVNYGRNSSMAELEKFTGYNRYHLMKLFKRKYDITIGEYINQIRRGFVAKAKSHGLSQKEISVQLGFASPASFWLWQHRDRMKHQK